MTFPFKKTASLGALIGALILAAPGAQAEPLEKELQGLLLDHPQIRAAGKGVEAARETVNSTASEFLPTVTLEGDLGPEYIDNPTSRGREDGDAWVRTRNVATLSVEQNIFNGFSSSAALRAAELSRALAEVSYEGTRQNTLFEGIRTYVDVLRQRRLVGLAVDAENTIQHQLDLEDERVQRGAGLAVDVLQAKSRLQIAKERRVSLEGDLQNAISRYIQVYDHAPNLGTMMDPAPPAETIPSELDRVIEVALRENPAVGDSDMSVEIAREQRNVAKSGFYPSLDVVGTANYEKHKTGVLGTRRDGSVLLQTTWDLFSGFATEAEVAKSTFDYRAAKDNMDYTLRKVVEQTRLAWQSLLTARQRLDLLENAVSIAAEVFEARKALREAGKETVINVLDAENEVTNAQINYAAALYDERVAIYQVLLAMGRLKPANLQMAAN